MASRQVGSPDASSQQRMSQLGSSDSDASMGTGSTTPAASIILASPSAEIEWLEARIANRKQKEAHQAKREEMLQWMLEQAEDGRADIWQQLAVATYDWEQLQANLQTLYQHNTSMMADPYYYSQAIEATYTAIQQTLKALAGIEAKLAEINGAAAAWQEEVEKRAAKVARVRQNILQHRTERGRLSVRLPMLSKEQEAEQAATVVEEQRSPSRQQDTVGSCSEQRAGAASPASERVAAAMSSAAVAAAAAAAAAAAHLQRLRLVEKSVAGREKRAPSSVVPTNIELEQQRHPVKRQTDSTAPPRAAPPLTAAAAGLPLESQQAAQQCPKEELCAVPQPAPAAAEPVAVAGPCAVEELAALPEPRAATSPLLDSAAAGAASVAAYPEPCSPQEEEVQEEGCISAEVPRVPDAELSALSTPEAVATVTAAPASAQTDQLLQTDGVEVSVLPPSMTESLRAMPTLPELSIGTPTVSSA